MATENGIGIPESIRRGAALCALLLFACAPRAEVPREIKVLPVILPLDLGSLVEESELSSLCWWGDDLLMLPQYPRRHGNAIFAIARDSIARAIAEAEAGSEVRPLRPRRLRTDSANVPERIRAYDGLEALSIRGDRCYLLAEFGEGTDSWGSVLISGSLHRESEGLFFERTADTALQGAQVRENFTHEALVLTDEEVWVICELNGRTAAEQPIVARFTPDLDPLDDLRMVALEYRVTDATDLDASGQFWVLDLFWPPDAPVVSPGSDSGPVERLVPLRREGDAIVRDDRAPVLDLRGDPDRPMHNWEGVARWGERGFLLVTDSYPENLLAYVRIPD